MFDITADHIARLDDESLRELVARLCEAESAAHGASPLAVTWGGDQNSRDGGIDVRVSLDRPLLSNSNLPRQCIGFQVKVEDMRKADILAEMSPGGVLRPAIQALAGQSGAYILVSSGASLSDHYLGIRRQAMVEAAGPHYDSSSLYLDFYDRTRVATWVREHPGLVVWVRERIGAGIHGWQPYGDWTRSHENPDDPFLLDQSLRIQTSSHPEGLPAERGVDEIRASLREPQAAVRLVGLSGTGKTRLVQALFDDRVGGHALSPDLAVYTNLSEEPSPQPIAMCTDLIYQRRRAVLIVDNCPPNLHRELTRVCRRTDSSLSLITVEYDVRDDQPEATDVFELKPASDDLIRQLLERRHPALSKIDIDTIADFSNGNARVALALASTLGPDESLGQLRDGDLFQRLFLQRNNEDRSLLRTAETCALVYSFQGEDISQAEDAELWRLCAFAEMDARSFHENLKELRDRDLLQTRGVWRALLPHAIANRLAASAIEKIPQTALQQLWVKFSPRLLRSFSRRLGYLHTSRVAVRLVTDWLSSEGLLGKVESLNELGIAMLVNVAPVAPAEALNAIERASERERLAGRFLRGEEVRVLVRSIAFDPELFDRAFRLLVDLIEYEEPGPYGNSIRNDFQSMFHLMLSGTQATIEQRSTALELLIDSEQPQRRDIGFACLNALLQTPPFSSLRRFTFGARSRGFGYYPATVAELQHWFSNGLVLCDRIDAKGGESSARVRKIVSDNLGQILRYVDVLDQAETLCRNFAPRGFWPEGWIALRSLRRFREAPLPDGEAERLRRIESILEPHSLQERAQAFVLRRVGFGWDDLAVDDWHAQLSRLHEIGVELGKEFSQNELELNDLLPDLVSAGSGASLESFAKGIVEGGIDLRGVWNAALKAFGEANPVARNIEFFAALLRQVAVHNLTQANELLVAAFVDPLLKPFYPYLQSGISVSAEGMARLEECLSDDSVSVGGFRNLGFQDSLCSDEQLARLVPLIAAGPKGFDVALDCLWTRLKVCARREGPVAESLHAAGREILSRHRFSRETRFEHHHYRDVAELCLAGSDGENIVRSILQRVKAASISGLEISFHEATTVIATMVAVQPVVSLDSLFADHIARGRRGTDYLLNWGEQSALDAVPESLLFAWCERERESRYPWVAQNMMFFLKAGTTETRQWKPIARSLLHRAPDRIAVMRCFIEQLRPKSWWGSESSAWEANLKLLDGLDIQGDPEFERFVREERARLEREIAASRIREETVESKENERFE